MATEIGKRIKELRLKKNLNQEQVASDFGISFKGVSVWENNGVKNKALLQKIASYYGVSVEYLKEGQEVEKENIKEFIKQGEKRHETQDIPLYDITAAAGLNALYNSENNVLDYLRIPNLTKCDGAIYIKGDSMYPLLKHGDIVVYQQITDFPEDIYFGEMYIVDMSTPHREKIVVKYVQKSELGPDYITLVSYNEKHHPPKDVHLSKVRAMAEVKASIRLT